MHAILVFCLLFCLQVGSVLLDDNACKKLKNLDYELYGTKTNYDTARRYLNKKNDLPDDFDDDSLEKEHKGLLEDSCTPTVFYFIGRHSARFPDGEDIDLYNKHLTELKDKLKGQDFIKRCPEKFDQFLNWTTKMQNKQDNLITETGARQQREIAKRFKTLYPEFFSTQKSDVKIGVTSKIRTAQTGAEFLRELDNFVFPNCDGKSLPTNDIERPDYNLDLILKNQCYQGLMEKHALPYLEFHRECEKISGKDKTKDPRVELANDPKIYKEIGQRVAKRLGLPKEQESIVNKDMLESIFDTCKFENVYRNKSVWCSLFEKKDVEALEYIADVESYIKNAYGPRANSRQACPLIKDLVENFHEGTKLTGRPDEKKRSFFYFSHAGPMKKLLGAFGIFQDSDSYSEKRIREFASELKIDKDREWRSSLIVPFSGNMAFVLYRCQKPGKPVKHKILATVTERPVKLGGCKETVCDEARFFAAYDGMRDCNLNKICARS